MPGVGRRAVFVVAEVTFAVFWGVPTSSITVRLHEQLVERISWLHNKVEERQFSGRQQELSH